MTTQHLTVPPHVAAGLDNASSQYRSLLLYSSWCGFYRVNYPLAPVLELARSHSSALGNIARLSRTSYFCSSFWKPHAYLWSPALFHLKCLLSDISWWLLAKIAPWYSEIDNTTLNSMFLSVAPSSKHPFKIIITLLLVSTNYFLY